LLRTYRFFIPSHLLALAGRFLDAGALVFRVAISGEVRLVVRFPTPGER
jgi:hypothetical protein